MKRMLLCLLAGGLLAQPHPPQLAGFLPAKGAGISQTFELQLRDAAGYQDVLVVELVLAEPPVWPPSKRCYLYMLPRNAEVALFNDSDTEFLPFVKLGTPGATENGQCRLDAGKSSVSGQGETLTIKVALEFRPGWAGPKSVYLQAGDGSGGLSWAKVGDWEVTAGGGPCTCPKRVYGVTPPWDDALKGYPLPKQATNLAVWVNGLHYFEHVDYVLKGTVLKPKGSNWPPPTNAIVRIDYDTP